MALGKQIGEFSSKIASLIFTPGPANSVLVQANCEGTARVRSWQALGFRRSGNGCLVSGILAFGSAQRSKGNSYNS
jgi:hypothetical protein